MDDIDIKKLVADYSRVIISNDPDEILARFLIGDYIILHRDYRFYWGVLNNICTTKFSDINNYELVIPEEKDITCYYHSNYPVYLYKCEDLWTIALTVDEMIKLLKAKFHGWQPD